MEYRSDIDGLRAIAVISVLIYHLDHAWLSGGFLGVDVFFVISGYLITTIIWNEREVSSAFSFSNFYLRRIKRLLPPLWPVLLFSSISALLLFTDSRYTTFVHSAFSSIGFVSNHFFATSYGYFNSPDHSTLLLHFWSLSVEEQFYAIWPVALILLYRTPISFNLKLIVLTCAALLSFAGATLMATTGRFENEAFYLLPPRAGELLVGCILALYRQRTPLIKSSPLVSIVGLALLLIPLFTYSGTTLFPGFSALLPCLGSALLLSQSDKHSPSLIQTLLGSRVPVYIGKISYSLYLWHWPLLAVPRYLFGELSATFLLFIAVTAAFFAHLSWQYIEQPARRKQITIGKAGLYYFVLPLLVLALVISTRGLIPNEGEESIKTSYDSRFAPFCYAKAHTGENACKFGDMTQPAKAILFGDSHAGHFTPFWDYLGSQHDFAISAYSAQTCYPLIDLGDVRVSNDKSIKDKYHCPKHLKLISDIVKDYDTIIMAAGWNIYFTGIRSPRTFNFEGQLNAQLQYFEKLGKKVIVMAQVPWYEGGTIETYQNNTGIPISLLRNATLKYNSKQDIHTRINVDIANQRVKTLVAHHPNTLYLDVFSGSANKSSPFRNRTLIYANADHLTPNGAVYLAESISHKYIEKALTWVKE